jgi:hypothetical protein
VISSHPEALSVQQVGNILKVRWRNRQGLSLFGFFSTNP